MTYNQSSHSAASATVPSISLKLSRVTGPTEASTRAYTPASYIYSNNLSCCNRNSSLTTRPDIIDFTAVPNLPAPQSPQIRSVLDGENRHQEEISTSYLVNNSVKVPQIASVPPSLPVPIPTTNNSTGIWSLNGSDSLYTRSGCDTSTSDIWPLTSRAKILSSYGDTSSRWKTNQRTDSTGDFTKFNIVNDFRRLWPTSSSTTTTTNDIDNITCVPPSQLPPLLKRPSPLLLAAPPAGVPPGAYWLEEDNRLHKSSGSLSPKESFIISGGKSMMQSFLRARNLNQQQPQQPLFSRESEINNKRPISVNNSITKTQEPPLLEPQIVDVWAHNLEEEFVKIRDVVERYQYVAMDTEFPGIVAKPNGNCTDYHYKTIKYNVDLLKVIQLGVSFADEKGRLPPGTSTWQFNFKFNLKHDIYAQDAIDFLQFSGIDFETHQNNGIEIQEFGEVIMSSGLVMNKAVKWISFHGSYDFGYLLKLLTCAPLPESAKEFFELLCDFFPSLYDIKYLLIHCESLKNETSLIGSSLQRVAEHLEVQRIGPQHQAGSDSLVTCRTFFRLLDTYFDNLLDDSKFSGVIYGLGDSMLMAPSRRFPPAPSIESTDGGNSRDPEEQENDKDVAAI